MKARLLRDMPVHPKRVKEGFPPWLPAETIIDNPRAYRLVQQGVAVPADKECEERTRITNADMDKRIKAYERLDRGIHMDDFDAYAQGLLIGYKPDGADGDTWIHGPNWSEGCEADYYSGQEDEDDDE
jgi:hypothetical protein